MITSKVLLPVWIVAIAASLVAIEAYQATPGQSGKAPARTRLNSRPRLLVFLHPRCPCSKATLQALQELLAERPDAADVVMYFVRPDEAATGFEGTPLWKIAAGIAGVQARVDVDGKIAHSHGAATSGHVVLYTSNGELQFGGGITPGRGASGVSGGRRALAAALAGSAPRPTTAPVFGCPLQTPVSGAR